MVTMRMMQPPAHEVIDVVTVQHRLVSAGRAGLVRAARLRGTLQRVGGADRDHVLVHVRLAALIDAATGSGSLPCHAP